MATLTKEMVEGIIENNGYYPGDPQIVRAVKYTNQWGGESYAVIYPGEDIWRYHNAPACSNVEILWERPHGNP